MATLTLPIAAAPSAPHPTAIACLRCKLLRHRNLICSTAGTCAAQTHVLTLTLGPILLLGCVATVVAFLFAIG